MPAKTTQPVTSPTTAVRTQIIVTAGRIIFVFGYVGRERAKFLKSYTYNHALVVTSKYSSTAVAAMRFVSVRGTAFNSSR